MRFPTFFILTGLASAGVAQASYVIEDDYSASSFFGMFNFFTSSDPTGGYVQYVDQSGAQSGGLINTNDGAVYMGVDSTNVATGSGRNSVRITSKKSYNHGLVTLDLAHMPGGTCGTWPAFWMVGPSWPNSGEIDIIEGVNSQNSNSMTLHTNAGCSITNNGKYSGTMTTSNCNVAAVGQATNAGCQINTPSSQSYGTGFNAAGGGVYATEWTSDEINIWFFPRGAIPSDITSGSPNPTGWGPATASFSGGCEIDSHFKDLQIVFDTTFCGDWAGSVWPSDSACSSEAPTCQAFVQNNPSAFKNAYWSVNSLKVYQSNGVSNSVAAPEAKAAASATVASVAVSGGVFTQVSSKITPLPVVAVSSKTSSTPLPVHSSSSRTSSTPLPAMASTSKTFTPLPAIASTSKTSSTPLPVMASSSKASSMLLPVMGASSRTSSTITVNSDISAVTLTTTTPMRSSTMSSLTTTSISTKTSTSTQTTTPTKTTTSNKSTTTTTMTTTTSSKTSAGNYVTVSALDAFDFPSSGATQTAGVPVPARKRHGHGHQHLRRLRGKRHGGI